MSSPFVTIAVLGKPRGNRGEITATPLTNRPERFDRLREVFLSQENGPEKTFSVEDVWNHDGVVIFKLHSVDSIDEAGKLRGAEVRVPASERVALDPGEFFHSDLIGCELRDRKSGRVYGKVTSVEEYGGPALLQIDGGKMLVPFVGAICVDIRPQEGFIAADLPEGLEDLDRKA